MRLLAKNPEPRTFFFIKKLAFAENKIQKCPASLDLQNKKGHIEHCGFFQYSQIRKYELYSLHAMINDTRGHFLPHLPELSDKKLDFHFNIFQLLTTVSAPLPCSA